MVLQSIVDAQNLLLLENKALVRLLAFGVELHGLVR